TWRSCRQVNPVGLSGGARPEARGGGAAGPRAWSPGGLTGRGRQRGTPRRQGDGIGFPSHPRAPAVPSAPTGRAGTGGRSSSRRTSRPPPRCALRAGSGRSAHRGGGRLVAHFERDLVALQAVGEPFAVEP